MLKKGLHPEGVFVAPRRHEDSAVDWQWAQVRGGGRWGGRCCSILHESQAGPCCGALRDSGMGIGS